MRQYSLVVLALAAVILGATPPLRGAQAPIAPVQDSSAVPSVLRVRMLEYDDSVRSLTQVRALSSVVPPRSVALRPGDSISAVILREYGFGPSNLPDTYAVLEARILELNSLNRPEEARAGNLLIPALPTKTRFNPSIGWNLVGAAARFEAKASEAGPDRPAVVRTEREQNTTRLGAVNTVVDFDLPAGLVDLPEFASLLSTTEASLPGEPMGVDFYASTSCGRQLTSPLLDDLQIQAVRASLASVKRTVPVFIADTGWPSAVHASRSISYLNDLLAEVRKAIGVPFAQVATPNWAGPSSVHSAQVASALAEFVAIDAQALVPVIFVPLSKEQGAESLLFEVIFTSDLLMRLGLPRTTVSAASVPPDLIEAARDFARSRVKNIPAKITGRLAVTEKAIVEGLVHVATAAALLRNSSFVVSASWTLNKGLLHYAAPLEINGLMVTAAGNFGLNVITDRVDLARRAATSAEFVTVLNMNSTGDLVCDSSNVGASSLDQIAAVGFNGDTADGSATSFATPRVAWLLALAEASRSRDVGEGLWATELRGRLISSRRESNRLQTDLMALLNLWR